jgi:hypothetical protein
MKRRVIRVRQFVPVLCALGCGLFGAAAGATEPVVPGASASTTQAPGAPATRSTAQAARSSQQPRDRAVDRLQLDATAVTGNRELPKVMSIVPWKGAEPPAGPDRPMGSLIDELLAPLDRDEFQREITYYRELTTQSAPTVSAPGASQP